MKRLALLLFIVPLVFSLTQAQKSGSGAGWHKNTSGWDSNYVGPVKYRGAILYVAQDSGASPVWIANKNDTSATQYFRLNPLESQIFFKDGPWIRFKAGKTSDSAYVRWHWDR